MTEIPKVELSSTKNTAPPNSKAVPKTPMAHTDALPEVLLSSCQGFRLQPSQLLSHPGQQGFHRLPAGGAPGTGLKKKSELALGQVQLLFLYEVSYLRRRATQ